MKDNNINWGKIYESTHWGVASTPESVEDEPNSISWGIRLVNYLKSLIS